MHNELEIAKRVINSEIAGLVELADSLDDNFTKAINIIMNCSGRVVCSGLGKSGHVARKIVATFASTGTPAIFIHPSEASHGDLGMITNNDVIILLSNSGNTVELNSILNYCKRLLIPIIVIVRNAKSTLATHADIALVLPATAEASIVDAPTTSSTMMMALGDAMAITLLEKRGFTNEHFKLLHPGGMIGKNLLTVADLMHLGDEIPLIAEDLLMKEALIIMTNKRFGTVGVISKSQKLIGIITDGDIRRNISNNLLQLKAVEVMTKTPLTITKNKLAIEALAMLNLNSISCFFVVNEDFIPEGIIHFHDLLRAGLTT